MTDKLSYGDLKLPFYLNSRPAFANLDVTDLVKAAVLGQLNILLVGETGCGKTQLAKDIYNSYFGGNKKDNGHGVFIRAHPEVDVQNEVFTELNIDKGRRESTQNIEAKLFLVDELNRAPEVAQNQFFGMGDGVMDYKGHSIQLGKDGQRILLATANIGNGEYQGTFKTDRALYNRLHFALDFDFGQFKPTDRDRILIRRLKSVNPNVKEDRTQFRDLTDKIKGATSDIDSLIHSTSPVAQAALNYIVLGLDSCQKNGCKEKNNWYHSCADCPINKNGGALCSMIREPTERTIEATQKYAAALYYLSKLKNPEQKIDDVDLVFRAFELTGAFQQLVSPLILRNYGENNPKAMHEVVEKLKEDFRENEDYTCSSLEAAKNGDRVSTFFEYKGKVGNYDSIPKESRKKVQKVEPYTTERPIRTDWMKDMIDIEAENSKRK